MFTEGLVALYVVLCFSLGMIDSKMWIVFGSSVFFVLFRWNILPQCTPKYVVGMTKPQQLTWYNTVVSLLHSLLCSVFLVAMFIYYASEVSLSLSSSTKLELDWIHGTNDFAFWILAISTGYFAYDLWDMVLSGLYRESIEIIVHHVLVITCYLCALSKTIGHAYLILALVCEINSVFLHLRKLMVMMMRSQQSTAASTYQTNALYRHLWYGLWGSFFVFRLVPHLGIALMVYQKQAEFPQPGFFIMAFGGMMAFNVLNLGVRHEKVWLENVNPFTSPLKCSYSSRCITAIAKMWLVSPRKQYKSR